MTELHTLPPRLSYLHSAEPAQLCEIASLRLDAVQALFHVLLQESHPGGPRLSPHTLACAHALLGEAGALYQRAFTDVFGNG